MHTMKRSVFIVMCCGMLGGCLTAQDIRARYDPWIGQHKDAQIKKLGPPTSCSRLSNGEEVCEWDRSFLSVGKDGGGTVNKRTRYVYDKNGVVREWGYSGPYGLLGFFQTNMNSTDPIQPASTEPTLPSRPE